MATEVYQTAEHVYGLAWGEFDTGHEGMEVACLTQSGSLLQLSPRPSGWEAALRDTGELDIPGMYDRPTIGIGDVYSDHSGNEIVIEDQAFGCPSRTIIVFRDATAG